VDEVCLGSAPQTQVFEIDAVITWFGSLMSTAWIVMLLVKSSAEQFPM
jgi:hypothetical protein